MLNFLTLLKGYIKKMLYYKSEKSFEKIIYTNYFNLKNNILKEILKGEEANNLTFEVLQKNKPCLVGRLGSVEQQVLHEFLAQKKWSKQTLQNMPNNAGFFPVNNQNLEKFANLYLKCVENVDILGVWFNEGEKYLCENYAQNADFVTLNSLEPYYHNEAWSRILEHKKVLVIHPFAKSIEKQYSEKRQYLFENKFILPEFSLQVLPAVQSIAHTKTPFNSWFEALEFMQNEIQKCDFDVALIGAGAYGLPLGHFIKNMGKQAIHLGGALQILFGIKGKRWEEKPFFQNLFNEYWVKPSEEETPLFAKNVEKGCYW